nr:septal ring lytic transglycosylase RlpA family protein [Kibdelosporangium sp. MJ126-NF4]
MNTGGSGESCAGLDKALQNNLNFIAGQRANPDAQSAARIANRQAVVDLIQQRRQAAGCTGDGAAEEPDGNDNAGGGDNAGGNGDAGDVGDGNAGGGNTGGGGNAGGDDNSGGGNAGGDAATGDAATGEVVCQGATVTLSGEGGAPAASSNQFPLGTRLRVTNLDNNKSTTVEVASVSGSCALLNDAAFEQVREAGKFLIRRARIERVGS